jgi:hypothetical protein
MQFEHDTLLMSARLSGRTLPQEWKAEVRQQQGAEYAGQYLYHRTRATKQFAQKHDPPEYTMTGVHAGADTDVWAPDKKTRFESTASASYRNDPKKRDSPSQRSPLERRPSMREGESPTGDLKPGPTTYPRREYSTLPTAEEEMRKLSVSYERYVDGDRSTEVVPAVEWLSRADANPLVHRKDAPPMLPRHSARDHLSDVRKQHALFDPARPQIQTVVRVTRRQTADGCSAEERRSALVKDQQAAKMRDVLKQQQAEKNAREASEANELLELYSMGIRGVLSGTEAYSQPGDKGKPRPVTRSQTVADRDEQARQAPAPATAAFAAREAVARAAARGFQPAESAPAAERPLPKSSPENELSWVKGGSVPIVKATRPKEVPLVFPPGTFDIRQQDAQHKLKQAQRFAPTRASG